MVLTFDALRHGTHGYRVSLDISRSSGYEN